MKRMLGLISCMLVGAIVADTGRRDFAAHAGPPAPAVPVGWASASPRNEIQPNFDFDPKGGPDGLGSLTIKADQREGLAGCWKKTWPVVGGKHYHFVAQYQAKNV